MNRCPENYEGDHCQWPICGIHGRVNVITRTCECYSNFAPPFCQDCLPRFWGEKCTHSLLLSTDARDLDFFPFCRIIFILFVSFTIAIIFSYCCYFLAKKLMRKKKDEQMLTYVLFNNTPPIYSFFDYAPPPSY